MRRPLAALLLALALASPARAAEVTPRQRALLLLRVLVYDRALPQRAAGEVRVAVVFRADGDEAEHRALLAAFEELSATVKAAGLPVRAVAVPYEGAGALSRRLATLQPAALYACRGLGEQAAEVGVVARGARVLGVTGERRLVVEGAFPLALVDRGDRAGLVLDPEAAAAVGAEFDSALLSVAELVKGVAPVAGRP
jgi:hypothetical protein